ncbi:MAG: O-antigen ligase family protein [Planctomycetales bacterium]|nr:O-antigen ligase family protein [Planctomycetales bacterium]
MNLRYAGKQTLSDLPFDDEATESPRSTGLLQQGWLDALCVLLLGYALFGKGFAYLGASPLFVGELVLLTGTYVFLRVGWKYVIIRPTVWPLLGLAAWGTLTTLPHVSTYGIDSIRDAMIWGYAIFAFLIMGVLLSEPGRLQLLIERYSKFTKIFVLAIPCTYVVSQLELVPNWPWANVAMIDVKVGDVLVHLSGAFAFWASGMGRRMGKGWIALLMVSVAVMGAASRGGLLAFILAYGICLMYRPFSRLLWVLIVTGVCGLLLLAVIDIRLAVPGKDREFSTEQLIESLASVFESSSDEGLDSTKQWRINWWTDIVNYTWNGPYFWQGKGFGINLADADGYQGTEWEGLLRSPHNGHLTMLARAGIPGFLLWILPQLLWLALIVRDSLRSFARGELKWNSLFVFLLAYWAAFITRATFDVYLEGPVGGIWFWTIYGVGLSATVIYRYCPQTLDEPRSHDENPPRS